MVCGKCGSVLNVSYHNGEKWCSVCLDCQFTTEFQKVYGKDEFIDWMKKIIIEHING